MIEEMLFHEQCQVGFYLGLRCVECGCLGCHGDWIPRCLDVDGGDGTSMH
jgi:hypothetical protein